MRFVAMQYIDSLHYDKILVLLLASKLAEETTALLLFLLLGLHL